VPLNLARYMPPMFAANMPSGEAEAISAVPLPPVPEEVESYAYVQRWPRRATTTSSTAAPSTCRIGSAA
jgi:hypothetical protein